MAKPIFTLTFRKLRPNYHLSLPQSAKLKFFTTGAGIQAKDVIVIGAGVVGLAIGRKLALRESLTPSDKVQARQNVKYKKYNVIIAEKESHFGMETSSRNSEVIHAGIYYKANSIKAKLCVEGKEKLYQYLTERNIPHRRIGKLIVACSTREREKLKIIKGKAEENGVHDLRLLSYEEVIHLEPELKGCIGGALFSPSTGILDSHAYMASLAQEAEANGAFIAYKSKVEEIRLDSYRKNENTTMMKSPEKIKLRIGDDIIEADLVINAAGLHAIPLLNQIPSRIFFGTPQGKAYYRQMPKEGYYCKGNYFKLAPGVSTPFKHLIYPLPEADGLGVHATLDLEGQTRFGPDVQWIRNVNDLRVDSQRAIEFYAQIRKYWPNLPENSLLADYAGIRPKLKWGGKPNGNEEKMVAQENESSLPNTANQWKDTIIRDIASSSDFLYSYDDFHIDGENVHGIPGLINLVGIESPGLTSSLAIADRVLSIIENSGDN